MTRSLEGKIEAGKRYVEADFNKIIEIKEREKKRVEIFMSQIDQRPKRLCSALRKTMLSPCARLNRHR